MRRSFGCDRDQYCKWPYFAYLMYAAWIVSGWSTRRLVGTRNEKSASQPQIAGEARKAEASRSAVQLKPGGTPAPLHVTVPERSCRAYDALRALDRPRVLGPGDRPSRSGSRAGRPQSARQVALA